MGVRLKVRTEWDGAVTYGRIQRAAGEWGVAEPGPPPVFVGRRDLLQTLVGALRQPERRGTVLLSGYRGSGKTTLLIESIHQATSKLPPQWRMLPLVLNASEVSAALGQSPAGPTLQIGAPQLMTALIRELRNRADATPAGLPEELAAAIRDTYRKAMAKEYSKTEGSQQQSTRTLTRDFELKLTAADAYKGLSGVGAAAAAIIEGSAWLSSRAAALHAAAVAAGGLAVVSWTASRKLSEVAKQERTEAVSVKFDNSLQQLEGDLKELLIGLYAAQRRTVVVLEELDKIQDEDGKQLDSVIRYFKNLFTQAPALFFFVTDKAYYDFISGEIRQGRRDRTYALQHTFFTYRLFVGRPTTRDCLDYLKGILVDPGAGKALAALYAPDGLLPFSDDIERDQLLRLVRYLLFKACNHFFDLKNELRRFIRTESSAPVLDAGLLTDDEARLGAFQDLVVETVRLFAIGDGQGYANEVLNDCLYAVFDDLGSGAPQQTASFYPRGIQPSDPAAAPPTPAPPGPSGEVPAASATGAKRASRPADQLDLAEQLRIRDAVASLIEDLHRGGAFDSERTNISEGHFVWKPAATRAFRFVRSPRRHEAALIAKLVRLQAAADALGTGGILAEQVGMKQVADNLKADLKTRLGEIEAAIAGGKPAPLVDETEREMAQWQQRARDPIEAAYGKHLHRAKQRFGFDFKEVGRSAEGSHLFLLSTSLGDPRDRAIQSGGAVLVAQGEGGRLVDDVREFVERSLALQRLALVHVLLAPIESAPETVQKEQWRRELFGEMRRALPNGAVRTLEVDVLSVAEDLTRETIAARWGDKLAQHLLFRASWAAQAVTLGWAAADLSRLTGSLDGQPQVAFAEAVLHWLSERQHILHIVADSAAAPRMIAACVDVVRSANVRNHVVLPMSGADPMAALVQHMVRVVGGAPGNEDVMVGTVAALLAGRAVIPIIDGTSEDTQGQLAGVLGDGGRAIVVAPESWTVGDRGPSWSTLRLQPGPINAKREQTS
jgi:hypothetical protein